MKLKLTQDLKARLRAQLASIVLDVLLDGSLDTPTQTAALLESFAREIRAQNAEATN